MSVQEQNGSFLQASSEPVESKNSALDSLLDIIGRILSPFWKWAGRAPLALKLVGLAVIPLLLAGGADLVFMNDSIRVFIGVPGNAGRPTELLLALTRDGLRLMLLGGVLGLALSMGLTVALVHPLHELARTMRRVQAGDLTARAPVWARDEIGGLQAAFNEMVTSLQESRETLLGQQRKLTALNAENTRLLDELRTNSARLQQLFAHAISAQEAERKRLARELHDETGQALTSMLLQLKALQDENDPSIIHDRLNGLRYLTGRTIEEVRRLSADLRPTVLDDLGLVPAIRWCIQECAERSGIEIGFYTNDQGFRFSPEVEIVLYRAAQEALTNIMRHSHAESAEISLERLPEAVVLTIADDGVGFEPDEDKWKGIGLSGMRERVLLAGGELHLDSDPGCGTRVYIKIPVETQS